MPAHYLQLDHGLFLPDASEASLYTLQRSVSMGFQLILNNNANRLTRATFGCFIFKKLSLNL
jgi:hypothetical protein